VCPQFTAVVAGEAGDDSIAEVDDDDVMDDDEEPDTVEAAALKQLEMQKVTPCLLGPDGKPLATADAEALSEFKEHIEELIKSRTDRLEESAEQEEKIRLGEEGWKSRCGRYGVVVVNCDMVRACCECTWLLVGCLCFDSGVRCWQFLRFQAAWRIIVELQMLC
jgi:hypothetical protein